MPPDLVRYLTEPTPGKFHDELLQHVKDLVNLSRGEMEGYYSRWDDYDMAWRGERVADEKDKKARERKEPEKFSVPITYSQVETFVAFCCQLYTQRPTFFELQGTGTEDAQAAKVATDVLEYNLQHNRWKGDKLQQFMRNIAKYGVGILKHSWTEETRKVEKQVPMPGAPGVVTSQVVDEVCYQGNTISVVSPYRFFPDPRVPLTKFQEGEFCASEDDVSDHQLRVFQGQGLIAGYQHATPFKADVAENANRRFSFKAASGNTPRITKGDRQDMYVRTEVEISLIPSDWEIAPGKFLGPGDQPEKYVIWYLNDNRIVRIEPKNYLHNQFNYDVAQFANDDLRFINLGLSELLCQLQDVLNWLINSHIESVRKVIGNFLVVDPKGVELKDIEERKRVIRLKPTVQGSGVDRWVHQLNVQDVTQNHMADAAAMNNFSKETTGITENLLGQFAPGRRSATEARNVSNNSAARLLLTAVAVWDIALLPFGKKLVRNCQDGMDIPQVVKVIGESNAMENQDGVLRFVPVDKSMIQGDFDFMIFDGTLPSQRGAMAEKLQELLSVMMAKPETAFVFQLDPRPILFEQLHLSGIRNVSRFQLTPQSAQQLIQLAGAARNAATQINSGGGGGGPPGAGP